jgi:hypothetical protein
MSRGEEKIGEFAQPNRIPKHPLIGQVVIRKAFDWEDKLELYRKLSMGNSRKGSLEKNFS